MNTKTDKQTKVAIVGGGLSGLCLAHALLKEGFEIAVFERDAGADIRGQGYRLTIDSVGSGALHSCLPASQYEFIRSTAGKFAKAAAFIFLDERARELHRFQFDLMENERLGLITGQVDRLTLRQGLLAGIDDLVQFGKAFSSYAERADQVHIWFEDGSHTEADILIGADGVGSAVRRQRLPGCNPQYTGAAGIFGRTRIEAVELPKLQALLDAGGVMALGPDGRAFFCTTMRFRENPAGVAARLGLDVGPTSAEDYIMWAVALRQPGNDGTSPEPPDSAALLQSALDAIKEFDREFSDLVANTEPNDTVLVPIRVAPHLTEWTSSRITLIGDAIHAMPPFGAHGANTSLKDAQVLSRALARGDRDDFIRSIAHYESDMRHYSQRAIRSSLRMMKFATSDFPFKKAILLAMLRIGGAFSK